MIISLVSIFYFLLTQSLIGAPFVRYMGVIFAIGYYVIVVAFGYQLYPEQRIRLATKLVNFSAIILLVECAWRLTHPNSNYAIFEGSGDVRWIYQYKFGGLMYMDSNAVAIHIIIILFFIYYLEIEQGERWTKTKLLFLILLILTFSRAGWIGGLLGWVYIRFLRKQSPGFYLINSVFLLVSFFLFYKFYLENRIESDLSLQSKLEIISNVYRYLSDASFQEILFGIGFSNSSERLGIYAHNFFMVFLIESGVIGLLLMIFLLIQFVLTTKRKALFIIIPFLITTLSSTITFMPFLYVAMALIFLLEKSKTKNLEFKAHEN